MEQAEAVFGQIIASGVPEWKFKSHKQLAKVHYLQKRLELVVADVGELVKMLPEINSNYAEESISRCLARYQNSADRRFVAAMYEEVVSHLHNTKAGARLWLRIMVGRLHGLVADGELERGRALIAEIRARLDTVLEQTRSSYLLDVIAAEIECVARRPVAVGEDEAAAEKSVFTTLARLYRESHGASPSIVHPRISGTIRECGATVLFLRRRWEQARAEFYELFKAYDEAGLPAKNRVLKYWALTTLLAQTGVGAFEAPETLAYAQLGEFQGLLALVRAYEARDLALLSRAVAAMRARQDPLVGDRVFELALLHIHRSLKVQMLAAYTAAYSAVLFDFLTKKLLLEGDAELCSLLLALPAAPFRIDFAGREICRAPRPEFSVAPETFRANLRGLHAIQAPAPGPARDEGPDPAPSAGPDAAAWGDPWGLGPGALPREFSTFDLAPLRLASESGRTASSEMAPSESHGDTRDETQPTVYETLFFSARLDPATATDETHWSQYVLLALALEPRPLARAPDQPPALDLDQTRPGNPREARDAHLAQLARWASVLGAACQ